MAFSLTSPGFERDARDGRERRAAPRPDDHDTAGHHRNAGQETGDIRLYPDGSPLGSRVLGASATRLLRSNVAPIVIGVVFLVIGSLTFQYVLGLNVGIAVVLFLFVVGTTLGAYRLVNRSPVAWDQRLSRSRLAVAGVIGLVVVALAIQAVPFGRAHSNPPVTGEPAWDSPRTRELTVRACFDCHSNEVDYPWYSMLAPMSWAVQLHVEEGREAVNYSEWDRPQQEADESAKTVVESEMPPSYYTLLTHSGAKLTDAERQELIAGLTATFGTDRRQDGRDDREDGDDD